MTIFEPLFVLLALAAGVALVVAAVRRIRGKRPEARRIVGRLAVGVATYVAVVAVTSFFVPRREYGVGDPQCFDDWCITVVGAHWTDVADEPGDERYEVALRLSSRARRMPMGERGTVVYLTDEQGHRYDPLPERTDIAFDHGPPARPVGCHDAPIRHSSCCAWPGMCLHSRGGLSDWMVGHRRGRLVPPSVNRAP